MSFFGKKKVTCDVIVYVLEKKKGSRVGKKKKG